MQNAHCACDLCQIAFWNGHSPTRALMKVLTITIDRAERTTVTNNKNAIDALFQLFAHIVIMNLKIVQQQNTHNWKKKKSALLHLIFIYFCAGYFFFFFARLIHIWVLCQLIIITPNSFRTHNVHEISLAWLKLNRFASNEIIPFFFSFFPSKCIRVLCGWPFWRVLFSIFFATVGFIPFIFLVKLNAHGVFCVPANR